MNRPYSAAEVAYLLGIGLRTFYRRRAALHAIDRLPRPLTTVGPLRFDRASIEAWLTRHHPARPTVAAANDAGPLLVPASDAEHRDYLQRVYR